MKHPCTNRLAAVILSIAFSGPALSATPDWPGSGQTSSVAMDRFLPDDEWPDDGSAITLGRESTALGTGSVALSVQDPFRIDPENGEAVADPGPDGLYEGAAQASAGVNKARARVEAGSESGLPAGWSAGVYSAAGWYDQITVNEGPDQGTLRLEIAIDGNISIGGPANSAGLAGLAAVGYNLLVSSQPFTFAPQSWTPGPGMHIIGNGLAFACEAVGEENCDYGDTLQSAGHLLIQSTETRLIDTVLTADIAYTRGVPLYLVAALEVAAYAFQDGAFADVDFYDTAKVTAFTAPAGAQVMLGSGQYAAMALPSPVPEPAAWWLVLCGLGTAALFVGRQGR